jgi:exopolysaccharide biosynthesis protein
MTTSTVTPKRTRRARIVRGVLYGLACLLLIAGATAYWALDEYIFDHVEVSDVDAYEAEVGTRVAVASTSASGDAVTTEDTYTSDTTSITISTVVTGSGDDQVTYYVADVVVDDATLIRGGFAEDKFGENIVEDTSDIAEDNDAIFAINGDYYGYRDTGIVIRNGVLYRDDGARTGLAMYADGTMEVYDETATTGEELLEAGVWNTLSFGPAVVEDGEIVEGIEDVEIDTNFGNHSIQGNQPRTAIGIIDTNHYVFVAVDGRSEGYSRGVTMTELAQIFVDLGATTAYNLDGGGSTTMVFDGELVNDPLGKGDERPTSDIIYVAG